MANNKVALIILDGWGQGKQYEYNAVANAITPTMDALQADYPHSSLACSGEAVGLPDGQMGNSEVGHLNIGAGRVVYQELTRISKDIRDGLFFSNPELVKAMQYAKDNNKALHLMGLLSDGGVHSHNTHLYALLKLAKDFGLSRVYIHAFLDGRDVPPQSGAGYVQDLQDELRQIGVGRIATIAGRYYAMDRDKRYERNQLAYAAMVDGLGEQCADAVACVQESYRNDKFDEFVVPCVIDAAHTERVGAGDAIIFFNFRPDRARQITRAFVDADFSGFARGAYLEPYFVCMTEYDATIKAHVAYRQQSMSNTLGEYLAKHGKKQLRIAETEKYAHVTFFFNGGVEAPNEGEERVLIPSPKVATYDLQPEMSAYQVKDKLLGILDEDKFEVIILNFANADMVGHTGVYAAGIAAMQAVDKCMGEVVCKMLGLGWDVLITADHGNLEYMLDETSGQPYTAHTNNPVELLLVSKRYQQAKLADGALCDLAPTMLDLLGLEKPAEMTGHSLIIR